MVTIIRCMCRGSLPVVKDESALIVQALTVGCGRCATRRQEKQAKQGSPTAVDPR